MKDLLINRFSGAYGLMPMYPPLFSDSVSNNILNELLMGKEVFV